MKSGAHVVVYGAPDWCGHCARFWPTFRAVAAQKRGEEQLAFSTCHIKLVSPEEQRKYELAALPTTVVFLPGGKQKSKAGDMSAEELLAFVEESIAPSAA